MGGQNKENVCVFRIASNLLQALNLYVFFLRKCIRIYGCYSYDQKVIPLSQKWYERRPPCSHISKTCINPLMYDVLKWSGKL